MEEKYCTFPGDWFRLGKYFLDRSYDLKNSGDGLLSCYHASLGVSRLVVGFGLAKGIEISSIETIDIVGLLSDCSVEPLSADIESDLGKLSSISDTFLYPLLKRDSSLPKNDFQAVYDSAKRVVDFIKELYKKDFPESVEFLPVNTERASWGD